MKNRSKIDPKSKQKRDAIFEWILKGSWNDFGCILKPRWTPKSHRNRRKIHEKSMLKKAHFFNAFLHRFFSIFDLKIHRFFDDFLQAFSIRLEQRDFVKIELPPRREHYF